MGWGWKDAGLRRTVLKKLYGDGGVCAGTGERWQGQ